MRRPNRTLLNDAWRFHLGAQSEPVQTMKTVPAGWETITLPHTWNAFDTMEPDPAHHYRRDEGWYARTLAPDVFAPQGQRTWLEVEAAAQRGTFFLNGVTIGAHAGGYTAFTLELTPERYGLALDAPLTLAARLDNLPDPDLIPSDMSDFFLYGGLTRNVWLYTTGPACIDCLFFDQDVSPEIAHLTLRGRLVGPVDAPLTLSISLSDPQGQDVYVACEMIEEGQFTVELPSVVQPELWSPDAPHLYRVVVTLAHDGVVWDTVEERLGFRFFDFPAGGPLYLNGERFLFTGTHRHEDWAGYGSAVPDDLTRREMELIRAAGLNFIRLGHYPQAPAVLDACDELGLLAWEELPWCRGGIGGDVFQDQARAMLVEMIEQHYNRPSIIFWGLGNELDWESEHPDSTDQKVIAFLRELHLLSHKLDPARLTAIRRFEAGADVVDVYSPSIWSGWYRGRYQDYEAALTAAVQQYPRMVHMEWGGDSHIGRHNAGPHLPVELEQGTDHAEVPGLALSSSGPPRASRDGDWSESYILDLMEWHLQVQPRVTNLAGTAQWAFKDFGTPLRPENPVPYVNQKGLVDRTGRPKDVYHVFKAYLAGDPVVYIESPTWPVRVGAPDEPQRVRVYANCDAVTLFVNGSSAGRKQRDPQLFPAAGLVWHVTLQPGENTLLAVGDCPDGQTVEHTITQRFTAVQPNEPVGLHGWAQTASAPDGTPAVCVTVQWVDADVQPVIADRRRVTFALEGGGILWANRGTPDGCRLVELANGRASVYVVGAEPSTRLRASVEGLPLLSVPVLSPSEHIS